MTAFLWDKKLTYVAVPKAACTSIKSMFFEIENGRAFREFVINGRWHHIHTFYPTLVFSDLPHACIRDHERLAVVRDPLERLLSCYSNRVVHHRSLSKAKGKQVIEQAGLRYNPSLSEFIDNLELYRDVSTDIYHHSAPQTDFLGEDLSYFARIYPISKLADFVGDVSRRVGKPLVLGRHQTGGPNVSIDSLTHAQRKRLTKFYEKDYQIFRDYI